MAELLQANTRNIIRDLGNGAFMAWLKENEFELEKGNNLFDAIESSLQNGTLTKNDILKGIIELEDNGAKKIFLYNIKHKKDVIDSRRVILNKLIKKGYPLSNNKLTRPTASVRPTFNYLHWEDNIIQMKFSEKHFDREMNPETDKVIRVERNSVVIIKFNLNTGLGELRLDKPGEIHTHKNEDGLVSAGMYEKFYVDLMNELFSDVELASFNMNKVIFHIFNNEKKKFRIKSGLTTVTGGAKQKYIRIKQGEDIRDLPEYNGAAASEGFANWLNEDLEGYWVAAESDGELSKDLFMKISRKFSFINFKRECLEKELNYGIEQVRKI